MCMLNDRLLTRVCRQIFLGVNQGVRLFGKFLKDYQETEW